MLAFKLTDEYDRTYNGCQWGKDVCHIVDGVGPLCTKDWIHFYQNKYLAAILNPIHGDFNPKTMHMWKSKATGKFKHDRGLKSGCTHFTTIGQIKVPLITTEQRVEFAILCAREVYKEKSFIKWANGWLHNTDRTHAAADAAHGRAHGTHRTHVRHGAQRAHGALAANGREHRFDALLV